MTLRPEDERLENVLEKPGQKLILSLQCWEDSDSKLHFGIILPKTVFSQNRGCILTSRFLEQVKAVLAQLDDEEGLTLTYKTSLKNSGLFMFQIDRIGAGST